MVRPRPRRAREPRGEQAQREAQTYLEELKADDDRKLERFFYQKWLAKVDPETRYLLRDDPEEEGATAAESARVTKVTLGDTEGVTRDEAREESLEGDRAQGEKRAGFLVGG